MAEKRIVGRAIQKHDIESNWLKATGFIPMAGEIIVYDRDDNVADENLRGTYSYERIKIGDGVKNVNSLPFVDDALRVEIIEQINAVDDKVDAVSALVGDTSVSDQISTAIAEIPEQIQVDWNQNNETAVDYIKSRTHYTEEYVLLDNFTFEGTNGWTDIEDTFFCTDRTYIVNFDGVVYECETYYCDWYGCFAIGNPSMSGEASVENNGMPFYICLWYKTCDIYTAEGTHTITISSTRAHTIDPIFTEFGILGGTGLNSEVFNGMPRDLASGNFSHSEGEYGIASGDCSHVEGSSNVASGDSSHAEGTLTIASGDESHAEGYSNIASGSAAHAEGRGSFYTANITGDANSKTYILDNDYSNMRAGNVIKHKKDIVIVQSYDPSTRTITVDKTLSATIPLSDAYIKFFCDGIASGVGSHTEGSHNIASGDSSHAEGTRTVANRANMHVSGTYNKYDTTAIYGIVTSESTTRYISFPCKYSFEYEFDKTTGLFTLIDPITSSQDPPVGSYVLGYYDDNGEETSIDQMLGPGTGGTNRYHIKTLESRPAIQCNGDYIHVVGNGDSESSRSNAHTLDWFGNAWFAGDIYVGGTDQASGEKLVKQSELPDGVTVDDTLANAGQAADAKVTGDAIANLTTLVGDTTVSSQIDEALDKATADDFGVYVQSTEPTNAVAGDIWIDTANDPSYIIPSLPEITDADNGKVLMVVNGTLQLVSLNLNIDANGVVSM